MRCHRNCLDETVLFVGPEPLWTHFGIHHTHWRVVLIKKHSYIEPKLNLNYKIELEDLVKHSQEEFWTILNKFSSQMRVIFNPEFSTDNSIPQPKDTDSRQPWLNKEDFKGVAIRPVPSKRYRK